jgi:hypothetical protein
MPATLTIGFFVFGAVLMLIGLVGGKFNIFVSYMPGVSNPILRIVAFVLGMVFLALAINPDMVSIVLAQSGKTPLTAEQGIVTPITQPTPPAPQPTQTDPPPVPTDTPMPPRLNPIDFVVSYWKNVSDGNLVRAWTQLSPRFRQVAHNNDYNNYVSGYQKMQLCRIDVSDPNLIQQDNYSSLVDAHFTYYTGSQCNSSEYDFEMWLIYDDATHSWLFDKNVVK